MNIAKSISLRTVAIYLISLGLAAMIGFAFLFLFKTTPISANRQIDSRIFGDYGVLVGGAIGSLFTLATVLLLIESLNDQQRNFRRLQVESRFFEMVKIFRENSASVSIRTRDGKRVFITLLREFDACFETVALLAPPDKFDNIQAVNVAYLCFYYGAVGPASEKILRRRLEPRYGDRFLSDLLSAFRKEQARLQSAKEFDHVPFDGHQSRLGHYFRHLFQSVRYIDEQPDNLISSEEKYSYVKLLRAQLSTQEQALFLLNSLSDLGATWERDSSIGRPSRKLVTTYNFIKNIPYGFLRNVEPRDYYPGVRYEGEPDG